MGAGGSSNCLKIFPLKINLYICSITFQNKIPINIIRFSFKNLKPFSSPYGGCKSQLENQILFYGLRKGFYYFPDESSSINVLQNNYKVDNFLSQNLPQNNDTDLDMPSKLFSWLKILHKFLYCICKRLETLYPTLYFSI